MWKEVKREDVIKAIELFNHDNPDFPTPRNTFLIYEGKKYPAKHIRGMAYKVHFNKEISKSQYTGGQETCNFFTRLGFEVQYNPYTINKDKKALGKKIKDRKAAVELVKAFSVNDKIHIPTKGVIEQKNALQLLLNKIYDGDIVCEKTFDWMRTPSEPAGVYKKLVEDLSNYRGHTGFAKKNVALRCDFVCQGQMVIIEYDERQHFSEARRISLLSYKNTPLNYDRNLWIRACRDIGAKDNSPVDRDEIRAYYDSVRDIEAQRNGYTLIRIMHGQIDFESEGAMDELKTLLENWTLHTN